MEKQQTYRCLPVLTGKRLVLRPLTKVDAPELFRAASDPAVSEHVSWTAHRDIAETEAFIRRIHDAYTSGMSLTWGIIEPENGALVGVITLSLERRKNSTADVGYWLARPCWGKGVMTEALGLVLRFGFEDFGLNRVQAYHSAENPASGRVMAKAGMTYEGTLRQHLYFKGAYHDKKMYSMLKEEYDGRKK